jgi:hypothetical protein
LNPFCQLLSLLFLLKQYPRLLAKNLPPKNCPKRPQKPARLGNREGANKKALLNRGMSIKICLTFSNVWNFSKSENFIYLGKMNKILP